MVVDDDDFVSSNIVDFVTAHSDFNGWFINKGYVWGDAGKLLMKIRGFHNFCGSSLIIKTSSVDYQSFDEFKIKKYLGSHIFIKDYLKAKDLALEELPFYGAIYRIGHQNAHSKSKSLLEHYFYHKWLLKSPTELARRVLSLKVLTSKTLAMFMR
jgi:hypothetical protein